MVIRNNDATINRPEGDRILNAPYVFINLPDFLRIIKEEKAWIISDRNSITVFKADGLSVVLTALRKGATLENVQTEGYMSLQLLEGAVTVTTPDGDMDLKPNEMMVFNPSIQYSLSANQESSFLLSLINVAVDRGNII